jgi:sugar phosphate isomerase/epimerase
LLVFDSSIVCCFLHPITKFGYPPAARKTVEFLEDMKDLGFQSVELEGIHADHLLAVYELRDEIGDAVRKVGLQVPYFCAVLPGLSSADPGERRQNLELFEKGCQIASEFGARGILDNAPIPPYRFPDRIPVTRHYDDEVLRNAVLPDDLDWNRYWDGLAGTFAGACDIADRFGLTFQIHPCQGALSSTTDGFLLFREAVDRKNLKFNLDTANLFALKDNPTLGLIRLAGHVDYVHLSDNRGHRVEHLVPGDGAIEWDGFFEALEYTGFDGHIGIDVGGDESAIVDIDNAYRTTATWLAARWHPTGQRV